jgi:hypothetical protein
MTAITAGEPLALADVRQPSDACPGPAEARTNADPWMAAMRRGDFSRAWQICDAHLAERRARRESKHQGPRHFQWIWDGQPLDGKRVLVRCYHGLGDTVQFIRFAAPLRRVAREVIVWTQPPLRRIVATAAGVDRVIPLHDGDPDVAYDCDIEIMELAHALRVDAQSIACAVPYLSPPRQMSRFHLSAHELSVGLVWRAGDWDGHRSLPAELLKPLAAVCGVRLFSLQCGPAAADVRRIPAHDVACENVEVTAATMQSLDLLITVDTFAAHLAGALGVPVWLLLHAHCDWRWMQERDDSVWYPTMRLFRQTRPGDWPGVIDAVMSALQHEAVFRS